MKAKQIYITVSVLVVLGLIAGILGCTAAAPSATPTTPPAPIPTTKPAPAQPEVIKWRAQTMYAASPAHPQFPGFFAGSGGLGKFLADWVNKRTNGRLQVDVAPVGSIIPAAESLTAIKTGVVDALWHTYAGFYTGQMPEGDVEIGMPFAWENPDEMWDAFLRWGLREEFEKIYAEQNAFPITVPMGNLYGIGTTFEIDTPDKIKGKKIRALGVYGELIKALGGAPTTLPMPELYMALQLGTMDGGIHGIGSLSDSKLAEPEKFFLVYPNMSTIGLTLLINLDKYNALPNDIKQMLREDMHYMVRGWTTDYNNYTNRVIQPYMAKGDIKLVSWSEADAARVRVIGIGLWDSVAKKSARTAKLVEIVKAQQRALGKIK